MDLQSEIQKAFKGHPMVVKKALACFIARGHLLIEDLPGVGKTLLAQSLAKALGLGFKRVQMTPDLMPSDITGGLLWIPQPGRYDFRPGPLFTEIVLLDELNRASSRTQSSVLQAMEERQVSVDGQDHALPDLFFLIATQNPKEEAGVNRLPNSQMDRFMMKLSIGMPARNDEKEILRLGRREQLLTSVQSIGTHASLKALQENASLVKISDAVLEYALALAESLRSDAGFSLSTRAVQSALHLAQAWALLHSRDYVIPEDVQQILPESWGHRLGSSGKDATQHVQQSLKSVRVL